MLPSNTESSYIAVCVCVYVYGLYYTEAITEMKVSMECFGSIRHFA